MKWALLLALLALAPLCAAVSPARGDGCQIPRVAADAFGQVSPNGRVLLFRRREPGCPLRESLWLSDLRGHDLQRLLKPTPLLGRVSWRADGFVSATVGNETRLLSPRGEERGRVPVVNPFWSPDSQRALYVDHLQLHVWPSGDIVGGGNSWITGPAWSPRGDRFAYGRRNAPREPFVLVVARADGSGETAPFTAPVIDAATWSPDGSSLAFPASAGDSTHVYVSGADSTDDFGDLTPGFARVAAAAWSPNGTWIAFTASRHGGRFGLYVVHPDGTGLHRIATRVAAPNQQLSWFPRSVAVAYAGSTGACGRVGIFFARSDGSGSQRLTNRCESRA